MDNAIWNGSQPIIVEVDCDDVHTMLFRMGPNLLLLKWTVMLYTQCYLEWPQPIIVEAD